MRSLYVSVLLSVIGTLALALVVFVNISDRVQRQYLFPVFEAMDQLELESARSAWESGGRDAVQSYLDHLNQVFGSSHFFLDSHGTDLVSGEQRGALLPPAPSSGSRDWVSGKYVVTHRAPDGSYWFVAVDQRQPDRWTFFPYYLLVIGVTGTLGWLAASFIVSPIRKVTATVERFGKGDLSARANMKRSDEIGELARSFDGMAERLETLLLSERRLLQDISHELRSPLTRLKLAIRLTRTAADPKTALDRVDRETNRITSLVSEIIEMTRLEGDPLSRTAEPVNIGQVVKETVDDCRIEAQLFRRCSIQVEGELSGEVVGDGELLRRAFENVLRNAIRYSPEGANIDVSVDDHLKMANLTVRDYGPGVPEELLSQIFEPFFRVEEAREEDTGGVGLGLSIAKRAVRLHRGTIVAENASPGLRVQISLPKVAG
ncbi:MAG TPA: ATP-binding protein [Candidatus Sulfotelmatobacter sp.]|nr:ATP-binding protein [Candidatus Sulfotelmatobacter sp.]